MRRTLWVAAGVLAAVSALAVAKTFFHHSDQQPPSGPAGFQEQAAQAGLTFRMKFLASEQGKKFKINLYDHGSGLAVGDYDGDGLDDIYFVNQLGLNALFKNRGDGTFQDVTKAAGVGVGNRVCVSATFADYDNDGRQDLFVTSTRGGNILFHNEGAGTFKEVTESAGVAYIGHSQAACFFDYDNDGLLDLLVANTAHWTTNDVDQVSNHFVGKEGLLELSKSSIEANLLYHNDGKGKFTEVAAQAGLLGKGWAADIAVFDYDDDGWQDVVITSMFGRAQLYRNNKNGTFTDVTKETIGKTPWGGMGAKVFDYNNDGNLDLYLVDMHSDMWAFPSDSNKVEEQKKYNYLSGPNPGTPAGLEAEKKAADLVKVNYDEVLFGNAFYQNLGNGKYKEVSDQVHLENFWPWGSAAGDFNNDGYEDVFIPAGMGYPFFYWPNYLMMNTGNGIFINRSRQEGIENSSRRFYADEDIPGQQLPRSCRAAACADFVGDGRLDIVTNNFNDAPYFFKNQFPKKNFAAFRLQGTRSNRDAIGAVVRLYTGSKIMTRMVQPASGYLAQSSKTLHFGLGDTAIIDRVEITWPRGAKQSFDNLKANILHDLVEPQ